jgi:hypothetical protein
MAKRGPGRPKGSKNKSSKGLGGKLKPQFSEMVLREASGVILFVLAIIILLGIFGVAGSFGIALNEILTKLIGWATFILPVVLLAFSIALFFPEKLTLSIYTFVGLFGFVASFAGMFQVFITPADALERAQMGSGGGIIGYYIQQIMLQFFNAPLSFFILVATSIIFFLIASNTSIRELIKSFKKEGEEEVKPKQNVKVNEPAGPKVNLSDLKKPAPAKPEYTPMVMGDDTGWLPLLLTSRRRSAAATGSFTALACGKRVSDFSRLGHPAPSPNGAPSLPWRLRPDRLSRRIARVMPEVQG